MVKLYFKNYWYDLTKYVDIRSINVALVEDGTQSTASFKIGHIKQVLSGLDLSRALPRLARVKIKDKDFIIQTDTVIALLGNAWSHEVECISPEKLAADTTSAGLTVTQPQGEIGLYYRSFSQNLTGNITTKDKTEITLTTIEQSQDLSEIENRTMKKTKLYTINFTGEFFTTMGWFDLATANSFFLDITIEVGGVVYFTKTIKVETRLFLLGKIKKVLVNHSFDYENVGTKEVKIYIKAQESEYHFGIYDYSFEDVKLTINSTDEKTAEKITLDYVVEKVLHNDANEQLFFLDDNSKAFLKGFYSYEWTLPESYLWLQLKRIADYVKAIPKIRFGEISNKKWVFKNSSLSEETYDMKLTVDVLLSQEVFMLLVRQYAATYPNGFILMVKDPITYWYAEIQETIKESLVVSILPFNPQEQTPIGVFDLGTQATIDDYAASIEINGKNVYSERNEITEFTTLRASDEIRHIDTESIIIPTTERVGEVVSLRIKIPAAITVGSVVKAAGDWVLIDTNRILRQEYYNTLGSMGEYTGAGRFAFSKNNTLYYIDGAKGIHGLSYVGETEKQMFIDRTYIRAIYEIVIAQLTRDNGDSGVDFVGTFDDGTTARDDLIAVEIVYRPYSETNAVVYKSDQSGFQFPTSKFLNETMALNSPDIIGTYTQAIADRSGGTVHSLSGECLYDELPDLISSYDGMILFGVSYSFLTLERVVYSLRYVKDYVFVSSYESYDKKERVYEVSRDSVQDRVIKKNVLVQFDTQEITGEVNIKDFTRHLMGELGWLAPRWATFNHDGRNSVLPCISQALGRVVEFRVGMKDNYSAGLSKQIVGGETYQQDVRYTNDFGRVEETYVNFYVDMTLPSIAQMNAMPSRTSLTFSQLVGQIYALERKDARERSVYSLQFAYLSENSVIIIYDSIGKYSCFVPQSSQRDIKWAEVSVVPHKQQMFIDTSTIIRDATATLNDNSIEIDTIGENAVVCYNNQGAEKEILLVDTRKEFNRKIYFRGNNK